MAIPVAKTSGPDGVIDREAVMGIFRVAALATLALLLAVTLLLAMRRLSGALQTPLSAPTLLAVGGLLVMVTSGVRAVWRVVAPAAGTWLDTLVRYAPSVALWGTTASISLSGSSPLGLAGCWLLVIAAEIWHWRFWPRVPRPRGRGADAAVRRGKTPVPADGVARQLATSDEAEAEDLQEDADLPANIVQRLTRARDAAGCDILYGSLRADLAADQRSTAVHVAFCPPFARLPRVAVEQTAGPDARIKVAQVLPYGARLDVRLARLPQEPSTVTLEIDVRATQQAGTAEEEG
jgi:hypothetical protein